MKNPTLETLKLLTKLTEKGIKYNLFSNFGIGLLGDNCIITVLPNDEKLQIIEHRKRKGLNYIVGLDANETFEIIKFKKGWE